MPSLSPCVSAGHLQQLAVTHACAGLSRSCPGLVINLQTHQQHDESVPRQDHVSSPPSWAAFKISAVEEVTRRACSKRRGTWSTHQAGAECREERALIIRDNKTPTAYTASSAPCDVPRVFFALSHPAGCQHCCSLTTQPLSGEETLQQLSQLCPSRACQQQRILTTQQSPT